MDKVQKQEEQLYELSQQIKNCTSSRIDLEQLLKQKEDLELEMLKDWPYKSMDDTNRKMKKLIYRTQGRNLENSEILANVKQLKIYSLRILLHTRYQFLAH